MENRKRDKDKKLIEERLQKKTNEAQRAKDPLWYKVYDDRPAEAEVSKQKKKNEVVLSDIRIPFHRLVGILVAIALAAIPAGIIVTFLIYALWGLLLGSL